MDFSFLRCALRKQAKNEIYPMKVGIYMFAGQFDNLTFVLTFELKMRRERAQIKL